MANTLLTIDKITKDALMVAENELTAGKYVTRKYDPQFRTGGGAIGDTLRVRKPARYVVTEGATFTSNPDSTEESTTIQLQYQDHVGLRFTSKEQTLSLHAFREQFLTPAIAALMNKVDSRILSLYTGVYNAVGTPGTIPNDSSVYLSGGALLSSNAAPKGKRVAILSENMEAALVRANQGLFQSSTKIAEQYERGTMGMAHGFRFSMDQNVQTHTAASWTASSPRVEDASISEGDSSIILDNITSTTDSIKEGDLFTIDNVYAVNPQSRQSTGELQVFVATADADSDGDKMTVSISPSLYPADSSTEANKQRATINTLPVTTAAVNFIFPSGQVSKQGMLWHPDAIALTTADLELPDAIPPSGKSRGSDNKLGISLRIVKFYDGDNDRENCRIDILYGVDLLRPEWACRVLS